MLKHGLIGVAFALTGNVSAGGDELAKALKAVTAAENYHFAVLYDGAGGAVEGRFQKGAPLFFKADRMEFFRSVDVLVYKQGDAWQRTRTGTLSDPLAILGASAKVRAARLPHEELALLAKAITNVKKTPGKDSMIITGAIDEAPARDLARTEDRDVARSAVAKLWLDSDGRLTKYEIAIRLLGKRGNADVDGVSTRTVTIAGLGTTKVEVPAAARKALGKD